jgi:hypothetical protein
MRDEPGGRRRPMTGVNDISGPIPTTPAAHNDRSRHLNSPASSTTTSPTVNRGDSADGVCQVGLHHRPLAVEVAAGFLWPESAHTPNTTVLPGRQERR